MRPRPATVAWWLFPSLFCLLVYWPGLRSWFQMDDFAWLALHRRVHDVPSFFTALFQPLAQGTIRPWSERLFFLTGWTLAGFESAPLLRAVVFLTQFGNLILLAAIARRLTGSALAGLLAPVLWVCNSNLYMPMAWTAAYNEIQCAFFLLLALYLFMRYTETGALRFYVLQFVVFLGGFGSLELNVVYPALAALFALCFARQHLLKTLPLFLVSAAYAVFHRAVAPPVQSDIYRMYFDRTLWDSLWTYLQWTFSAQRYAELRSWPVWPTQWAAGIAGGALAVFALASLAKRQWLAAFGLGWFLLVLSPVLPLRNHVTEYYLTIPAIGLALIGAWGISLAARRGPLALAAVSAIALLYAVPSALMARGMTREVSSASRRARTFLRSIAYAHGKHPDSILVIRNVDSELFWASWWDNPFPLIGNFRVFAAAESRPEVVPYRGEEALSPWFLSEGEILEGLRTGRAEAYEVRSDTRLRNVSSWYREILTRSEKRELPRFIGFGQPLIAPYLTQGWWAPEGTFRWMKRTAEFRVRGPAAADHAELIVRGSCPSDQFRNGPLGLTVTADGIALPRATLQPGTSAFTLRFPLPPQTAAKPEIHITITAERAFYHANDNRELSLAMASAEVTP